ncbi:MAG: transcriptional regulator [Dehalobacter sp. 4CP]|uniref:type IV toxin-antitoxin system AbiEi family antitoxin domain-containing protein n=1 Tax=Dehalobacter sp. CP TaxID=2594474 RepID=UPI0013C8CC58|nr:transcriptional regulator [Dehalobacter sp. 4CP]
MKHYEELLDKGCFTWEDVCKMLGNPNTASNLIQNYLKKGYIKSVKRNLYVAVNLVDNMPVVSHFAIAGHITPSAYVSHHSAFSYYGYTNQVFYDVYVSSASRFNSFEFDGRTYRYVMSRIDEGVEKKADGVTVTDLERTIIDGINDFEKIGGLEELLRSLSVIPYADESKLLRYLEKYRKQVLYQKAGYILEHFKKDMKLSDGFFEQCSSRLSESVRYLHRGLNKDNAQYNRRWQLFASRDLLSVLSEGGDEFAGI